MKEYGMKHSFSRYGLALGVLAPAFLCAVSNDNVEQVGRSFLTVRPLFQPASPELISLWRDKQAHGKDDGMDGSLQICVYGGQSTSNEELVGYFSPTGKCKLRAVDETNRSETGPFQLYAPFFSVAGTAAAAGGPQANYFDSTISLNPKHTEVGVGFAYRQSVWHSDEEDWGLFLKAVLPISWVKNELGLTEKVANNDGAPVVLAGENQRIFYDSMTKAFNQKAWKYGKIATDCDACGDALHKTGVADIQLTFGYEWLQHHPYHMEGYVGILIPTGNKVTSAYLFEPIVGRGKHFGIMWGSAFGCDLWDDCAGADKHLRFEVAMNSMYLFSKEQMRSFDLKGRPWSRYIDVYTSQENAESVAALPAPANVLTATPGINIFTRSADVTPGLEFTITPALVFEWCNFVGEFGYNYYTRGEDHIELCSFPANTIALRSVLGNGLTMPFQKINAIVEDPSIAPATPVTTANYSRSIITLDDIDINSAATPSYFTNTIYAALGYSHMHNCYPVMAGIGASYEFGNHTNAAVDRWTLWIKGSLSF
jgi:hypothetical protein